MSRRSLDETLSFIAAVDHAGSADAVLKTVLSVVKPFGFSQVLAGIIPLPGMSAQQQVANVVLHQWPEQWSQRYFSQGYLFDDPTIQRVTRSTEPFLWSELEGSYRDRPSARRIMGEAREFDLGFGFTVPMLTLDGQSAGFSIASDRGELPPQYRGPLQLLAIYAFGRALSLADTPPSVKLTPRETDVLQWIAEGKSDWEISKILHVSEHLVDKMARQIRIKFGAANRTQAVAQALRHRIIR
ncbi:MAG: LuxR family transcriptional regulator [Bradyrhizobium sp.]|uniref:helix-turn-helix transcriptional regulator n=1 Tax=Bradyrhizobium sp. TaxID=376 RepID=UPI001C29D6A3|nr:LuxR family transcriptional regulator [Bradyrhizobium sp.]MBU6464187.1 autoinducer binding domain-containing protein [Pseudomonadota bacterium]MDE2067899.1 LuxR family transcriptional regulator [Bradyrhizobium sp.]MDE2242510.1 LuxR family transcriptional regulator [Bradyrhizobium sp.]MDE2468596.1 LuxR family transcriptional regulator [Bradyrhizobium sp.]